MWQVYCLAVLLLGKRVKSDTHIEFGYDSWNLAVIHKISGQINPMETTKYIVMQVPKCIDVKYVSVMVYNRISTPTVTYSKDTNIVKISYKPLQISRSQYEIKMKGKRSLHCDVEELLNLWGGSNSCTFDTSGKRKKAKDGCAWASGEVSWTNFKGAWAYSNG